MTIIDLSQGPEFFSSNISTARRFYLDLAPRGTPRLVVVSGGYERVAADYVVDRRTFPYYSVEYVVSGRGKLTIKGKSHGLEPGSVFSYAPGVPHRIVTNPSQPLQKYFVDFAGTAARRLLRESKLAPGTLSRVHPVHYLRSIFDELIEAGLGQSARASARCGLLLEALMLKIADSKTGGEGTDSLSFSTYQRCRATIESGFLRFRTLRQIAQECHVDPAYLCRLFRRYDHQSPYQLLLRLKMNAAAESLLQPGALVKQVAEQLGFTDPFHFSRAFKASLGLSPETFRNLRWGHREAPPGIKLINAS